MIEWRFTPRDVASIRFALSPLWELVLSLIVLRAPGRHWLHQPWAQATRPRVAALDLTELYALVPTQGVTVDFLTPPPVSSLPDFAAELDLVRRTPPQRIVADVAEVPGIPAPVLRRIEDDPAAAADRIADTMRRYWELAVKAHWPRVRALLEADVLWRSRQLATGGARAMFDDLHETVSWDGDRLSVTDSYDYTGDLSGEGLVLVPSAMCWPAVRKMVAPYQATIMYPVRGVATLWETAKPVPPDTLAALIGRTRAFMLLALSEPVSTTALARRFAITPGAVSQHLSVLLDSGLAARSRVGRTVLYQRTRAGDLLITASTKAWPSPG